MYRKWALLAAVLALGACSPSRFFFYPTNYLYTDPASKGLPYESIEIPSLSGKKLKAIVFRSKSPPKGAVVHCHGNFGNLSCHWMGAQFLQDYGFDVYVFDYEGYGGSEGHPGPKQIVDDGIAVVRFAQENLRPPGTGVVLFGQSLGGAAAAVIAAKEPLVKAVVLEAAFYSYNSIAREVLSRSVLTWILYPFYPPLLGRTYNPSRWVEKISPKPVFFIHGDHDTIVPMKMSKWLYEKAKDPKRLWIIKGADHLQCRRVMGKEYEEAVADFFTKALQK